MDDVKRGYREVEDKARETARELDGHDVTDDIGNAGDEIRKHLGNAGDDMRQALDETADRATDEADRRV